MNKRLNIFCGFVLFLTEGVELIAGHRMFQNFSMMLVFFVFMILRIRQVLPYTHQYTYSKGSGICIKFGFSAVLIHAVLIFIYKPLSGLLEYSEMLKGFASELLTTVPSVVATFIIDLVFMIPCSLAVPLFFIGMNTDRREDLLDDEVF